MTDKENESGQKHVLTVGARTHAEISGVTDVESFDEQTVVLVTVCGPLTLEGEELHVSTLDMTKGLVAVTGRIHAAYYADATPPRKGLRGRLFG